MLDLLPSPAPGVLSAIFQALADERRREMVARLSAGPMTVSELAGAAGMRLPAAVKHLALLEAGGIVASNKVGRIRTFQIEPRALGAVADWVGKRRAAIEASFDRLEQAIADFPEE